MRVHSAASLATFALLAGGLACAGSMAQEDEGATTTAQDTTTQNPPGYRGMERDTSQVPPGAAAEPVDTFLQRQGTGAPQDTMGYSGLEHGDSAADTTGAVEREQVPEVTEPEGVDTTTMDTTTMDSMHTGMDSMQTEMHPDTSGMSPGGDTTTAP